MKSNSRRVIIPRYKYVIGYDCCTAYPFRTLPFRTVVPHCSPEELGGDSKPTPTAYTPQLAGTYTKVGKPWIIDTCKILFCLYIPKIVEIVLD